MNEEQAKALRKPFNKEDIGLLPKLTCGDCSKRQCQKHQKKKCGECGNWLSTSHIHLDFVGHAALTDRLLQVDPEWTWEPMSVAANGAPALDDNGGMWIRLTVCGVTRIGYGDADGKRGGSAVKETIGDALRNAGMRFGMALDQWRKEPLPQDDEPHGETTTVGRGAPPPDTIGMARAALAAEVNAKNYEQEVVAAKYVALNGVQLWDETDAGKVREYLAFIDDHMAGT